MRATIRRRARSCRCVRALVFLSAAAAFGVATAPATLAQEAPLERYAELDPDDLPERYRVWIEEEVVWIITEPERRIFLRLDSDDKRDRFIDEFWAQRDPTPGTPRNEYRTQHYERLEYADYNFGREAPGPGWRSDMGRVYILLGEPQSRTPLHNNSALYPTELWMYQQDNRLGLPTFFYVVFFREQGMGEFELYSPITHGPNRLLNPSGAEWVRNDRSLSRGNARMPGMFQAGTATYDALRLVHPDLADAAFSLIPGEAFVGSPLRSETVLADILTLPDRIMPDVTWATPILTGAATIDVRFETLELQARAVGWLDPAGRPFVSYVMRAPAAAINVAEYDGDSYMTFTRAAYVLDEARQVLGSAPPRRFETPLRGDHLDRIRRGALMYVGRLPAVTGELAVDLMLENNVTREYGEVATTVRVPTIDPPTVQLGQPVLCAGARRLQDSYDPFGPHLPFQVGDLAMTPTVDGPFATGSRLYVFHQVAFPHQRTDPVTVTYVLSAPGAGPVSRLQVAIAPPGGGTTGVASQVTSMALDVPPGKYELEVRLDGTEQVATLPVDVNATVARPIVHAAAVEPATAPGELVARASVLRAAGRFEEALQTIELVLQRLPDDGVALGIQLELLDDLGRVEDLEEVLRQRLIATPNDIDLLERLADTMARQGEHYDAIRFYERAVLHRSDRPALLNALAAEYLARLDDSEDLDRAIDLLERSLAIKPDQSGVATTLERALAARAELQ